MANVTTNFNVSPYYDDYDEDKAFLRVLFRPGYAVQGRELTQLQTILQKQSSRFGDHIFKDGSKVLGGEVTLDTEVTDRKSTRLNSSHVAISYAVFCLKKKKFKLYCQTRTSHKKEVWQRSDPTSKSKLGRG